MAAPTDAGPVDLPLPADAARALHGGDPERALYVLSVLEAVEWKWTPAQVLEQDEALLEDVMTVAGWLGRLRRANEKPHDG